MDEKYQKKEAMDDLHNKDMRIQSLEISISELHEIVDRIQKKLDIAIMGLNHIDSEENWIIAKKCLDEIFDA